MFSQLIQSLSLGSSDIYPTHPNIMRLLSSFTDIQKDKTHSVIIYLDLLLRLVLSEKFIKKNIGHLIVIYL